MRIEAKLNEDEHGGVFVWVMILCAICLMVVFGIGQLGRATRLSALAQNAADAAALSGAHEVANYKSTSACSSARNAASRNEARVVSCAVKHSEIVVTVEMVADSKFRAKARAEID